MLKLHLTAKHQVPAEPKVFLRRLTGEKKFLANSKVNKCELELTFFSFSAANVIWFEVSVRVTNFVKRLKRSDDLS